jgi:hypothetical protein
MTYHTKEKAKCTICGQDAIARRLCKIHYNQATKAGNLQSHSLIKPEDVFWEKVNKTDTCWLWLSTTNQYGYGIFLVNKKSLRAHRYAYQLTKGEIPANMVILHTCDNPVCVNPSHLKLGTKDDNNKDSKNKMRNAFGEKNGHAKLTMQQTIEIRASTEKQSVLVAKYNVNQSTISRIKSGTRRAKG